MNSDFLVEVFHLYSLYTPLVYTLDTSRVSSPVPGNALVSAKEIIW